MLRSPLEGNLVRLVWVLRHIRRMAVPTPRPVFGEPTLTAARDAMTTFGNTDSTDLTDFTNTANCFPRREHGG